MTNEKLNKLTVPGGQQNNGTRHLAPPPSPIRRTYSKDVLEAKVRELQAKRNEEKLMKKHGSTVMINSDGEETIVLLDQEEEDKTCYQQYKKQIFVAAILITSCALVVLIKYGLIWYESSD
uniref:Uncharacterized protein n=1 Tax=Clytia hemisphaerica TaxID=252671 RepID=A0A7M5V5Q3_9CNID